MPTHWSSSRSRVRARHRVVLVARTGRSGTRPCRRSPGSPSTRSCDAVLRYRHDRSALLALLLEASEDDARLAYLNANGNLEDSPELPPDIDPFTVMGAFNRGVTDENRQSIAERLGRAIGVTAELPQDFDGIPVLNNMKSWFIGYAVDRGEDDVESLWRAFEAALTFADSSDAASESLFVEEYDTARKVRGVHWNLSVGLYWARPSTFMTLDSRSRPFIRSRYHLEDPADGAGYLAMCSSLESAFSSGTTSITSFPLLSFAAWSHTQDNGEPHTVEGLASWASRVAQSIDIDAEEHEYKRHAAALAEAARSQAAQGSPEWTDSFKAALRATNTIDFRFKDTVNKAIAADPSAVLDVFDRVWSLPDPASLDDFQEALRTLLGKVTPGNATSLGALLLMAADPEDNAPYSPTRTERWYQLTQHDGPERAGSAASRYTTMLAFLDELRDELATRSEEPTPSRLEAQGMAWATTESAPPVDWDDAERAALIAWRGQTVEEPRAWLARSKTAAGSWMEEGYVSLPATYLGSLAPGSSAADIKSAIEAGYQHQDYSQRKALEQEYYAFLTVMRPGDVVATVADAVLHVGRVEGEAGYVEGEGDRLRRPSSGMRPSAMTTFRPA